VTFVHNRNAIIAITTQQQKQQQHAAMLGSVGVMPLLP